LPTKFHNIHESTVPNAHRSSLIAVLTCKTLSISHFIFKALKYVLIGRPHSTLYRFAFLLHFNKSSSTVECVLVSSQTKALYNAFPVILSHKTVVSL
jgi:hypothetical protein